MPLSNDFIYLADESPPRKAAIGEACNEVKNLKYNKLYIIIYNEEIEIFSVFLLNYGKTGESLGEREIPVRGKTIMK